MEIIKEKQHTSNLQAVIFDFDGTISTLRYGWEKIMYPMMMEMILPNDTDYLQLSEKVIQYIDESTGIQTIFQMQWLRDRVKEYGQNPKVKDEWWYKDEYNRRLMQNVQDRIDSLKTGKASPADFMMKGSKEFVEALYHRGIQLFIASGTDNCDVIKEVEVLGLSKYFEEISGAPHRKVDCSKEAVIKNLIENKKLSPENLLVIGDGKVEIALGNRVNAITIGIASDEEKLCGVNQAKRDKLIKAGADVIIGDYLQKNQLFEWLNIVEKR